MSNNRKSVHFLGIGGIGMSGLALWYKNLGWSVTGSDIAESPVVDMLRRFGIDPEISGNQIENIPKGVDLGDYSDDDVRKIIAILNGKPRKSLNYKTATEVMVEHNLFKNKKFPLMGIALRG